MCHFDGHVYASGFFGAISFVFDDTAVSAFAAAGRNVEKERDLMPVNDGGNGKLFGLNGISVFIFNRFVLLRIVKSELKMVLTAWLFVFKPNGNRDVVFAVALKDQSTIHIVTGIDVLHVDIGRTLELVLQSIFYHHLDRFSFSATFGLEFEIEQRFIVFGLGLIATKGGKLVCHLDGLTPGK